MFRRLKKVVLDQLPSKTREVVSYLPPVHTVTITVTDMTLNFHDFSQKYIVSMGRRNSEKILGRNGILWAVYVHSPYWIFGNFER